jgi:tetratricopeptide (TPR) repeat protein
LIILLSSSASAQNKLTNATQFLREGELDKAKELIDATEGDSLFTEKSSTFYYKGYIYKELFKEREADVIQSPYRVIAVESFKKSIDMDPNGTFSESSRKNLKYLAETVYNHAATSLNPADYEKAITNYRFYKEIMSNAYPNTNFQEKDIIFNLALATVYNKLVEMDSTNAESYYAKMVDLYNEILAIDSNNVSANYNMGILYYNQGVDIVNAMDYGLDLEQLNELQDRIVVLFKKSLPYMLKAYELDPEKRTTLTGLQGIYFSLNDMEKSDRYKNELDQLDQKQSMSSPEPIESN